ncbi:MAG TPA: hypothetical protein DCP31_40565, partial [Cyanobacteria bacterium UBA8543]|nr:hypothetical protein [Cyanobacteria bacterium UBA8543]
AVCDWTYEFSRLKDNWKDLFTYWVFYWDTVNSLPELSKSTMLMENETIYEAPANETNTQSFVYYMIHWTGSLWVDGLKGMYHHMEQYGHQSWWRFSVNMGRVSHPN